MYKNRGWKKSCEEVQGGAVKGVDETPNDLRTEVEEFGGRFIVALVAQHREKECASPAVQIYWELIESREFFTGFYMCCLVVCPTRSGLQCSSVLF